MHERTFNVKPGGTAGEDDYTPVPAIWDRSFLLSRICLFTD